MCTFTIKTSRNNTRDLGRWCEVNSCTAAREINKMLLNPKDRIHKSPYSEPAEFSAHLHYATNRTVAGSISDVTGFFSWPNHSSLTMTLVWSELLTETSTRTLPGVKGGRRVKADNLMAICEPIVKKSASLDAKHSSVLKIEAADSSETFVAVYHTTHLLQQHRNRSKGKGKRFSFFITLHPSCT
jgi:hypothetical protein